VNNVSNDDQHPETDAEIVCDVLEGDTECFGTLVDRYKNLVLSYIAARVPSAEVEDLAQETFLRAFRVLASLRDPAALSSWLLGIANHVCIDWHRSRRRLASYDSLDAERTDAVLPRRDEPTRPDEEAEKQDDARRVLQTLDQLPETYRVTLVLKHMDGLSCTEIAEQLGVALGTVTSRLTRGYKMLRERLDELAEPRRK
jgi:RNA polymerase sigma-70 factor (ECF subfamily)